MTRSAPRGSATRAETIVARNEVMSEAPALWFTESGSGPDPFTVSVVDMDDAEIDGRNVGLRVRRAPSDFRVTGMGEGGFYLDEESATKLRDGLTAWLDLAPKVAAADQDDERPVSDQEAAEFVERTGINRKEWAAEVRAKADSEKQRRTEGCLCHWEEGDSPCPEHGDEEGAGD